MRHVRNAALTLVLGLTFLAVAPCAQAGDDEAGSTLWDSVVEFAIGLFDQEDGEDPPAEAGPIHDPAG